MRVVLTMMSSRAAARRMTAARKMKLSLGLMKKHMAMLHTSISGERTAMRRIIW